MQKLISFAVPSYNSQDYLSNCIESLLKGGEDVEIIIVDDGSTDSTAQIADRYAEAYPSIVRAIHKPNGGHGSGVNRGLKEATGLYYKVVDSDDKIDEKALKTLLSDIKTRKGENALPDLYITNFVYDRIDGKSHVSRYKDKLPVNKIFGWGDIKRFRFSRMLLMHSLLYKREKLIASGLNLPEHTFYVDNIYAYTPLPYMQTICYLDVNLYLYFIGREDQSVNRKNFVRRYAQQIRVMECMTDAYTLGEIKNMPRGLKNYMWHALENLMLTTLFFTCSEDSPEREKAVVDMWSHIRERDEKLYKALKRSFYSAMICGMPWHMRGFVLDKGYKLVCKRIKLGY